jgi:hypothetical protein
VLFVVMAKRVTDMRACSSSAGRSPHSSVGNPHIIAGEGKQRPVNVWA